MAGLNLFTNNAATTLASSISNVDTSLTVATSTGNLFPTLTGSEYFFCTLANTAGTVEIIKVTARSGDTFSTIVRGQDGTSAVSWSAGDKVELRLTRIDLLNFPQLDSTNTFAAAQTFSSTGVFSIGTSQFYKDASGNVGIGTASPTQKLQVYSSGANGGQIQITNASTGATATDGVLFGYDTSNDVVINNQEATLIKLYTSGTECMRITSAGNVGIGTSSPAVKLQIEGDVRLGGGKSITATTAGTYTAGSSGYLFSFNADGNLYQDNYQGAFVWRGASFAEQMRITSDGLLKFNSGYGSVATAYGCRAWVNFDGTANSNLTGTYSQTGTTVTVTITAHGYVTGQSAFLDFTSGTAVDGAYTVTVTGVDTFTVTQASRTTSGNVTSVRNTIRGSGNVSSITDNGTGNYTVNFTDAMPDINYSFAGNSNQEAGTGTGGAYVVNQGATTPTTSAFNLRVHRSAVAYADAAYVSIAFFR